jgi:ABC-type lipoprotein release transport system permease subunit
LTLPVAQEFFTAEKILTSYVMDLTSTQYLESTARTLRKSLGSEYEVMTWKEMLPEVDQHIQTDKGSMYIIQGILYLLICFGIFGTLLMMMAERKYEMGMLIAIGMKKRNLVMVLLIESVMNVLLGCIAGMLASIPIVYYLNKYPIRFSGEMAETYSRFGFEPIFPASVNPVIFITQGIIVLVLGFVLSLYPMIKVLQLNPVTAMKK